ncbi:leishmanolysin-related zinc metalloendopeptidase [Ruegeria arenilitoris]|uniref:leishmanolysin-related zinc metalloendopeptidase n=1 Tax=Ruegeria arenilitoris TaxID=1173585 RepID=UPI00147A159C|nr:leishmanolysin-related zinc metalloendopeptidase [Ruegeria arenilitoris]
MRYIPKLPDVFGEEIDILESLFGELPPTGSTPMVDPAEILASLFDELSEQSPTDNTPMADATEIFDAVSYKAQGMLGLTVDLLSGASTRGVNFRSAAGETELANAILMPGGYDHDHDSEEHHQDEDLYGAWSGGEIATAATPGFEYSNVGPPAGKGPNRGGGDNNGGDSTSNTLYATYTSGQQDTGEFDYFNINIQFYGEWSSVYMDAFAAAADFLSSVIVSGLRDDAESFNTFSTDLFTVDDVLIEARLPEIDQEGGILGRAGAYSVREGGTEDEYTTVVGVMEFDSADAASLLSDGTWDDTILHEMIHVLGFGSLWDNFYPDLVTVTETVNWIAGEETRNPRDDIVEVTSTAVYNGAAGTAEYLAEKDASMPDQLVVETDGGSGTALAHWDEFEYDGELMTGYLNSNASDMYLSDWSLMALEDIGYDVTDAFEGASSQNALADGVDLESADPLLAFYDADGSVLSFA